MKEEILNTNAKLIEYVSKKFNYSEELVDVLNKIVPALIDGASKEELESFYSMLKRTPILVIPEEANIDINIVINKYMADINDFIENKDMVAEEILARPEGAFISEPIFDDDVQITGSKQFIFVKKYDTSLNDAKVNKVYKLFGTGIYVPQLIQELGHAWASEKNQYVLDGEVLTKRIGVAEYEYKIVRREDEEFEYFEKVLVSKKYQMLEQGLNSLLEQQVIAKILDVSPDQVSKMSFENSEIVSTEFNGIVFDLSNYFVYNTMPENIRTWRFTGNKDEVEYLFDTMAKTKIYTFRQYQTDEYLKRRELFKNPISDESKNVFIRYQEDFFPDKENMNPIDVFNNTLKQCYDVVSNREAFEITEEKGIEFYRNLVDLITVEGYVLAYQTSMILSEEKVANNVM